MVVTKQEAIGEKNRLKRREEDKAAGLFDDDGLTKNAAQIAALEADERKEGAKEKLTKFYADIDQDVDNQNLIELMKSREENIGLALDQQDQLSKSRLSPRKEQLKARRAQKKVREMEDDRIAFRLGVFEKNDKLREEMQEAFVLALFKRKSDLGPESPEQKQLRMDVMTEVLSDQFFERFQQLLAKQHMEKEQLLKNVLQRYQSAILTEQSAIKAQFKQDYELLESIRDKLEKDDYQTQLKQLRLWEENQFRKIKLTLEKILKDEEASLRKELEKKHNTEQVEFKEKTLEQQNKLRRQCVGDEALVNIDRVDEEKTIENFRQLKKIDQTRRLRNIDLQKKNIASQIDRELAQMYETYEDMIRRKGIERAELANQMLSLKNRIEERKQRLSKTSQMQGLSKEQQEAMLRNYHEQLKQLDSAYLVEQRRQRLMMYQQKELRRRRAEKLAAIQERLDAEQQKKSLGVHGIKGNVKRALGRQKTIIVGTGIQNDELLRKLRAWKLNKKEFQNQKFMEKLGTSHVDLDDASVKILILKLMQIEKHLKEVGRQKKGDKKRRRTTKKHVDSTI